MVHSFGSHCLRCALRAVGIDHPGDHVVDRHIGRDRRAAGRQRLEDQCRGQAATARSRRRLRRCRRRPCRAPRPCAFRRRENARLRPRPSRSARTLRRQSCAPCRARRSDRHRARIAVTCAGMGRACRSAVGRGRELALDRRARRATATDRAPAMPIAMAMTKTITPGDSVARSAIAGPGHKPDQAPTDAEQCRAGRGAAGR